MAEEPSYSRRLIELKKQYDSGKITNEVYIRRLESMKKECAQVDNSLQLDYNIKQKSTTDVSCSSNLESDKKMIDDLIMLAEQTNPNLKIEKHQRRRVPCQTNTSS